MKKEVIVIFLVVLLVVMPFSSAQISSINVLDVNVSDNQIQVLVENKFDKDFNKITFIIHSQYEVIKDEILSNFTAKFFYINYPGGIKLETVKVSVDGNEAKYDFTGNEDKFILNQAVSQTSELTQVESNSPVSYIYSAGRVAKIQDNNVIYFQSDNVGSTSLETDNIGNVNFKANYLPFGKELSFSSQGKEKYGFASKEHDIESSLNYFNARYYNPSSGKFISNDPIFKPTEGGYQYVRNNPLTITDPSGKQIPDNSKLIKLSFSVVNYIQEHAVRLIPKQCIERCQIEKAKQDKIKKANSEERSFVYDTLIPSVGNGIMDVTLPIRVNPAVETRLFLDNFSFFIAHAN